MQNQNDKFVFAYIIFLVAPVLLDDDSAAIARVQTGQVLAVIMWRYVSVIAPVLGDVAGGYCLLSRDKVRHNVLTHQFGADDTCERVEHHYAE